MNSTSAVENKSFKLWMSTSLGLIKDNKMGANKGRAERIKTALAYMEKGRY